MSNALVCQSTQDIVATTSAELPLMRDQIRPWALAKLTEARAEYDELHAAAETAKKRKWNPAALRSGASRALKRVMFYEKVVAALEAGYMLFPPVPNADVIAIRTNREAPSQHAVDLRASHGAPTNHYNEKSSGLPLGEGEYKSPVVKWYVSHRYKESDNTDRIRWLSLDLKDPEFPLLMGKPEIIEAVNHAQELKVFDEIRMFPFERRRRGDPCILGSIVHKQGWQERRLFFLISWRITQKDI